MAEQPDLAFTRTIHLLRHGAYISDTIADDPGPGLCALGIAQARLAGARLRDMGVQFDHLFASTLSRAHETATVIREALPQVPFSRSPLLCECCPPAWQDAATESSEAKPVSTNDIDAAFGTYFVPATGSDRHQIMVTHGNAIRYLVTKALQVDTRAWRGMSIAHASLTTVRIRADRSMSVISVGDIGHIPADMQSWGHASEDALLGKWQ